MSIVNLRGWVWENQVNRNWPDKLIKVASFLVGLINRKGYVTFIICICNFYWLQITWKQIPMSYLVSNFYLGLMKLSRRAQIIKEASTSLCKDLWRMVPRLGGEFLLSSLTERWIWVKLGSKKEVKENWYFLTAGHAIFLPLNSAIKLNLLTPFST
jgi:hypothetical protein